MPSYYKPGDELPYKLESWPWCAVCDKAVEKLGFEIDRMRKGIAIAACCHGEMETVLVPVEDIHSESFDCKLRLDGKCFDRKALPAATPPRPFDHTPATIICLADYEKVEPDRVVGFNPTDGTFQIEETWRKKCKSALQPVEQPFEEVVQQQQGFTSRDLTAPPAAIKYETSYDLARPGSQDLSVETTYHWEGDVMVVDDIKEYNTTFRGYFVSPSVEKDLIRQCTVSDDPTLSIKTFSGIEIHVRDWMPNDIAYPIPADLKGEDLKSFEGACYLAAHRHKRKGTNEHSTED